MSRDARPRSTHCRAANPGISDARRLCTGNRCAENVLPNDAAQKSRVTRTGLIVSRPASIGRVLRYRARFERKVYHNSQLQPCLRP